MCEHLCFHGYWWIHTVESDSCVYEDVKMRLHVIIQILKNRQCVCVCSSCVSADVSTCCNSVFVSTDSRRHMDPWITWTSGCRRRFKIQHLKRFLLKMTTWLKIYFLVGLWVWWHTSELHGSVYCYLQHKTVKWRAAAASSYRDGPNKYITVTLEHRGRWYWDQQGKNRH